MKFQRAHRVENSTKYRADDLCVTLVCEYFDARWPPFFFGRSLPFLILSIILKKQQQQNLYVGSFNFVMYYSRRVELLHGYRGTWLRSCIFLLRLILPDLTTYAAKINQRGIEWSLRAFAGMRAVRLFLRARAVTNFLMGAASTLKIINGEQRPPFVNFRQLESLFVKRRCYLADTFKTGQQAQS